MKVFIILNQSEIHDISENLPVEMFIDGKSVVLCSDKYFETENSEIENPCKTCSKYVGNMCEHVCEKRYEYVMNGGGKK